MDFGYPLNCKMPDQILPFIKLHFLQLKRVLFSLGLFRFVFVLVILILGLLAFFTVLKTGQNLEFASAAMLVLLASLQIQRRDRPFLRLHFSNFRTILFAGYLMLSVPVLAFLVYFMRWELVAVLLAGTYFIPFIELKLKNRFGNSVFQKWLPNQAFEWKAGVRKNLPFLLLIFLAGIGFSFLTGAVPLAIFALGVFPIKFYEKGEPVQMLIAGEQSAMRLMLQKFRTHFSIFSFLSLPLIIAFLLFHFEFWYIVLAEYVLFLSLHLFIIVIKYAFYLPNEKPAAVEVFTAVGTVGIVVPFLLPIVWVLTVWMFFRAKSNLKPYLHDFDN